MYFLLDIETRTDTRMRPDLLDRLIKKETAGLRPDGRIKDPDKAAADLEEKRIIKLVEMQDDFPLRPMTGQIGGYGLRVIDGDSGSTILDEQVFDENETVVINTLMERFSQFNYVFDRLITFNGKAFDIPFWKVRAMLYGYELRKGILTGKYSEDSHLDIRLTLSNFDDKAKGTLDDWAVFFGYHLEPVFTADGQEVTGALIPQLFVNGDIESIKKKNQHDLDMLEWIFRKIVPIKSEDYWNKFVAKRQPIITDGVNSAPVGEYTRVETPLGEQLDGGTEDVPDFLQ